MKDESRGGVLRRASLRRTHLIPLLLAFALALAGAAPARAQAPAAELGPALASVLEASRASLKAPGAVLYVAGAGVGAHSVASGVADAASGAPMGPGSRVRVASLTKSFVAVVALQLVEEGWLLLDHTVERWLPGLVPGGERITVRMLLSHTSGLPDYLVDGFVGQARRDPGRVWAPEELVREALRRPARFAPGAPGRWSYANTNYILLGMIVERVTGNPLAYELEGRIIAPLGLRDTGLAPPTAEPGDLARGYVKGRDYTALNMSVAWAAGGMYASAADVGVFLGALLGGELLRPETLAAMQGWVGTGGAWGIRDLAYGLGLMRRTLPPAAGLAPAARLAIGHTGALGGYRIAAWHLPASGITVVAAVTAYEADPTVIVVRTLETLVSNGALRAP